MSLIKNILLAVIVVIPFAGCDRKPSVFSIKGNVEVSLTADTVSVLRNPCCGWGLYDDADGEVAEADSYWEALDAFVPYASFFYVRWRWSDMEPVEGRYAWKYDENYRKLIKGALDRGLRLAFRIYYDSKDNLRQATPDYVRKAGAKGRIVDGLWTPYIDDPVFREKLTDFVAAFAEEYDNPDIVDFVDGVNAGWWGECHHLNISDKGDKDEALAWFTSLYGRRFKRVPLVMPVCSGFGYDSEKSIAVDRDGYAFRRDGLGSKWFTDKEKATVSSLYPGTLLIGESCYWKGDDSDSLGFDDPKYHFKNWRQVFEATYKDAIEYHFNTLDLRRPLEARRWLSKAPDLVDAFVRNGGYRLCPEVVSLPVKVRNGSVVSIGHRWENLASGIFPNSNKRWGGKYRVAFALLDVEDQPLRVFVDSQSDPGTFLKGNDVDYLFNVNIEDVPEGDYTWGVAIVDTSEDDRPGIRLAVDSEAAGGWVKLNTVKVR